MECNVRFEFYRMLSMFLENQLNILRLSSYKFMQLEGKTVELDLTEYFLNQVGKILGILSANLE